MSEVPIAIPTSQVREAICAHVQNILQLVDEVSTAQRTVLDWLRTEHGIDKPGQKLLDLARLSSDEFVSEVRKRRRSPMMPAGLAGLRQAWQEYVPQLQDATARRLSLESRIGALVFEAYGLSQEEISLVWQTAPPRMPYQ